MNHATYKGKKIPFAEYAPHREKILTMKVRKIFSSRFARWQWLYQHNPEFRVIAEWLIALGFGVVSIIAIIITLIIAEP